MSHTRTPLLRRSWATPVLGGIGVLAFVAVWEFGSRAGLVDSTYLPPFSEVAAELLRLLGIADFWVAAGDTMRSWTVGLVLSIAGGVALGFAIGSSRFVRRYTSSTVEFLRPIPSVALIPIAIVVFGMRPAATVFVVVWACFWVVLIHVIAGLL
jgi:ABC-type nitrate/sulfonate/bicarbonate transport system permease component